MKKGFTPGFVAVLLLLGFRVVGQTAVADSGLVAVAGNVLYRQYAAGMGFGTRLYLGPEYVSSIKSNVTGHQYFDSADAQLGTVDYHGTRYRNVDLRYDLVRDMLVIKAPADAYYLELVPEKVTEFTLGTHAFVRVRVAPGEEAPLRTGFHELLADGPLRLLAARRKSVQSRSTPSGKFSEVEQRNDYFLSKDGRYYKASSANSVISLYPEHKAALRKYIKEQKLSFSPSSREQALAALVRYTASVVPPAPAVAPKN